MTTNAELLRRALDLLDISGVELARRLSAARDDGRQTGTATVSRWLTAANPVDPGVMLYVAELLRARLRELGGGGAAHLERVWAKKGIEVFIRSGKADRDIASMSLPDLLASLAKAVGKAPATRKR